MLSHCDEKHSEMMWRECSSCPQRDGKLAVAFVYSFVLPRLRENMRVWILAVFYFLPVHLCIPYAGRSDPCYSLRKRARFYIAALFLEPPRAFWVSMCLVTQV